VNYARAVIASVLATGLTIIVVLQEIGDVDRVNRSEDGIIIDGTFALLLVAIIILTVPDAIAYFRSKKEDTKEDE
jgi:hypothetical protein